ncbi:hypothetical protein BYT27DRAFT_7195408 [Phlegmacium glaucopus]|nr:hypothetical protein BYT27DRAFT_7195408 [Phlegmacium glaucopus]
MSSSAPVSPSRAPASTSSKKPASKTSAKKPASKAKAAAKPKATRKASVSKAADTTTGRPSWKDIIKECIAVNKEDARQGVSRNTIKRYAEETYKIDMSGLNLSQLNRAITSGTEGGIFVLPKGPSGKVKLAPKTKPLTSGSKENSKPPSKPASTQKAAAPAAAKKTAAAPKKVLASKAKKPSTTTKKVTVPSKRGTAKKAVTGAKVPVKKAKKVR